MRVSRSLTIKQMALVTLVAIVTSFIFITVLLFHFVQQSRYTTAQQMESIAHSIRIPLSEAVLRADIPQAETILNQIQPSGIVSRADVVLPNQFQALHVSFTAERIIPVLIARVFELPVQISLPLYSLERPANPQPLAYLVLQADSLRMYKFILSTVATLTTTFLLLTLVLSVAITWCINRLMVHPLRKIARELHGLSHEQITGHQLLLSRLHHDDEIGLLVRSYNRNQQFIAQWHHELSQTSTKHPVSGLPNQAILMAFLEQQLSLGEPASDCSLLVIGCDTLQEAAGVLTEPQRDAMMLMFVEKMKAALPERTLLTQLNGQDFAVLTAHATEAWAVLRLAHKLMNSLTEKISLSAIQLRPIVSTGIALSHGKNLSAEQLLQRGVAAMVSARRQGKNQILFFDPVQTAKAQQRLTEESDILDKLEQNQFATWLQPQLDMRSGQVVGAEVLLRLRQSDGSYDLPADLIERIEALGIMTQLGNWLLEEVCHLLANWQARNITLPLSVNISALQLQSPGMVAHLLQLLQRYAIRPGLLRLEITETVRITDFDKTLAILRPLREAGLSIALDDFGMGHANLHQLNQLKNLPVDVLKMDKSFIEDLPADSAMAQIILSIADALQIAVIAEGVENEAQRDWLLAHNVYVAQGYLYSSPLSVEVFEAQYL